MKMYYARSTGGFYDQSIHGDSIPADAVEITSEQHIALIEGQSQGRRIVADENGFPILVDHPAPTLADSISGLIKQIDADADAIYTAALGNRATEYAEAEAESLAYKNAGYAGNVPAYVQAWADAKQKTAQWAADDILATSAAWRAAQTAIRSKRLVKKEAARKAADFAALEAVKAEWQGFVTAIRGQLGVA